MGPLGFEPRTKGFTLPRGFPRAWTISSPSSALRAAGRVRDAEPCHQGHCSPQVVSAPSGSAPPARLRIAIGASRRKVSLNSSRPLRGLPREGTSFDESPALTAVLQAQTRRFYRIEPVAVRRTAAAEAAGATPLLSPPERTSRSTDVRRRLRDVLRRRSRSGTPGRRRRESSRST